MLADLHQPHHICSALACACVICGFECWAAAQRQYLLATCDSCCVYTPICYTTFYHATNTLGTLLEQLEGIKGDSKASIAVHTFVQCNAIIPAARRCKVAHLAEAHFW
jgi:hypothetical protein